MRSPVGQATDLAVLAGLAALLLMLGARAFSRIEAESGLQDNVAAGGA